MQVGRLEEQDLLGLGKRGFARRGGGVRSGWLSWVRGFAGGDRGRWGLEVGGAPCACACFVYRGMGLAGVICCTIVRLTGTNGTTRVWIKDTVVTTFWTLNGLAKIHSMSE